MSDKGQQSQELNRKLLDLVHAVSQADDFREALQILVKKASLLVPVDGLSVLWLAGDHLEVLAGHGPAAPLQGLVLPVSQIGAAQTVLDSDRPVVVDDTGDDPGWQQVPGEERVRSWMAVPLQAKDWTLGLLEWTSLAPEHFDREAVGVAQEIGRCIAPILHRAQFLDDTRERLREQAELYRSPSSDAPDMTTELQPVVQEALDFTGARHAFVFLLGNDGKRLRCVAATGEQRERLMKVSLRGDGTMGGWSVPMGRTPEWLGTGPSDREVMAALGIERTLILPLRIGGEQLGMLGVAEPKRGRAFNRDAIRLMTHLASQASVLLERLYQQRPPGDRFDYETVFLSSPLGVGVLTVSGEVCVSNPALAAMLSQSERSLTGRNLIQFLVRDDGQRLLRALEEVSITGQRRQIDARVRSVRGDHRHVRVSLALAHISGDANGGLVAMMEDITPLKILEQERVEHLRQLREKHTQLQELDQLKSRFVSNVSHELRTPLAVIKLYATLARKGRPEKQDYYLRTIEQETHRLETMVENILDLTRLERRSLRIDPERLSAEEVIDQVLQVQDEEAQRRRIELKNLAQKALPPLWADRSHLIQMLTNLIGNGLKYTPPGGQVWVAAREIVDGSEPMLELVVGDTGVGIPEDEQEKVFERFYRGSNNTAGSTGTGLGLAIVQELMALHGGSVTLKSQPGEGSIFALRFPLPNNELKDAGTSGE
ncbi:MAG: ATP-binding protein [Anaerolineae bacterium]